MGSRPAVYSSHKNGNSGITTDFRVHAPAETPLNEVLEEIRVTYLDLINEANERWTDEPVVEEPLAPIPDGDCRHCHSMGFGGYSTAF